MTEAGDPEVRQLKEAYSEALWLTEHLAAELRSTVDDLTTYLGHHIPPPPHHLKPPAPKKPPTAPTERGASNART